MQRPCALSGPRRAALACHFGNNVPARECSSDTSQTTPTPPAFSSPQMDMSPKSCPCATALKLRLCMLLKREPFWKEPLKIIRSAQNHGMRCAHQKQKIALATSTWPSRPAGQATEQRTLSLSLRETACTWLPLTCNWTGLNRQIGRCPKFPEIWGPSPGHCHAHAFGPRWADWMETRTDVQRLVAGGRPESKLRFQNPKLAMTLWPHPCKRPM